jgi:hypothetical protein
MLGICLILFLIWLILHEWGKPAGPSIERVDSHTVVQSIRAMGNLELVQFQLQQVITKQIENPYWFNTKVLLIVVGEARGCVDLSQLNANAIEVTGDSLTLHLPQPELCVVKVDHQRTRVYDAEFTLLDYLAERHGPILESTFREAEAQMKQAALQSGILETTRSNAVKFFDAFFARLGYRNVRVDFR